MKIKVPGCAVCKKPFKWDACESEGEWVWVIPDCRNSGHWQYDPILVEIEVKE